MAESPHGGVISNVVPGSPADKAKIKAGDIVLSANGKQINDLIDWLWITSEEKVVLKISSNGKEKNVKLRRKTDEMWGIEFESAVFDEVRLCKNGCTFCFVNMLPPKDDPKFRPNLYVKDDDYRLSFLQGNFVTLTNLSEEDIERIISLNLSPLHVSLHAVNSEVRRKLIGKHAARGMEALERILDAGVDVHVQLVLLPGVNDGDVLIESLDYIEAHDGILSCGIVPLGFSKFQNRFDRTFTQEEAAFILDTLKPYQERALQEFGTYRYQPSDEFYLLAKRELPPTEFYDDFPQYADGIGLMRVEQDDWERFLEEYDQVPFPEDASKHYFISGESFYEFMAPKIAKSRYAEFIELVPVKNVSFGGSVNVTGLLCAEDIRPVLAKFAPKSNVYLPHIMLNDDMMTLDGIYLSELQQEFDLNLCVLPCTTHTMGDNVRYVLFEK